MILSAYGVNLSIMKALVKTSCLLILGMLLLNVLAADTYSESGNASWYGPGFQGRLTASGERFDTAQLTAAHKTLPFGSLVRVTNRTNGLSVVVRINDRGPFIAGRIIDLSRAAAEKIDMLKSGTVPVTLELVQAPSSGSTAGGTVSVQVVSFRSRGNAEVLLRRLKENGMAAGLQEAPPYYRVTLQEVSESELPAILKRLEELGIASPLIRAGADQGQPGKR